MLQGLKRQARGFALRYLPGLYHRRAAWYWRKIFKRDYFPGQTKHRELLYGRDGEIKVLSGPFAGMKYFNEVVYFTATPRWLGCYELELHPFVRAIQSQSYKATIDVGCAEGYYAVGLALTCPTSHVYAFDTDPWSRDQCRRLGLLNGVGDRLTVGGFLEQAAIEGLAAEPALIVCDIEGYEVDLLDPEACPALRRCDLLVEVHEFSRPGEKIEESLTRRFAPTHRVTAVQACQRDPAEAAQFFPAGTPQSEVEAAMDEHRPPNQRWLWLERLPKSGGDAATVLAIA